MKTENLRKGMDCVRSKRFMITGAAMVAVTLGGVVRAEEVDSELLLLVDTSIIVSAQNFNDTLESFARSFEDPGFISTLQGGSKGKIAASLAMFSGPGSQAVAVPWMSIGDASSAQAFADAVRSSSRPFSDFVTSFVEAFGFATTQFGSETGGPGNGFEGGTQVINVTSESFLFPSEPAAAVQAATSQAISDGVDVINAMVVGTFASALATAYYADNIVGGSAGGVPGTVSSSPNYASLTTDLTVALNAQMSAAIPEPASMCSALAGLLLIARRRRA